MDAIFWLFFDAGQIWCWWILCSGTKETIPSSLNTYLNTRYHYYSVWNICGDFWGYVMEKDKMKQSLCSKIITKELTMYMNTMTWRAPLLNTRCYKKCYNFNISMLILIIFQIHISYSLKYITRFVLRLLIFFEWCNIANVYEFLGQPHVCMR